jgi:hypothetical protein
LLNLKENTMTQFTTIITSMYTLDTPDPDYVVNVLWTVTGVDGEYTASIQGNTQFNSADQEGAFIPYESLTQAQVIGWIPESQITSAQQCVQGQLDSMANPPISPSSQPLPW